MPVTGDVRAFAKAMRNAYWRAHVVEYTSDRFWAAEMYRSSGLVPPRPTIFSERFRSSRRLIWASRAACLIWSLLFPLLMMFRYGTYRIRWRDGAGNEQGAATPDRIVLCLSPIIIRSLGRVPQPDRIPHDYVVMPPWEHLLGPVPEGGRVHRMLGHLDRNDLWNALRVSLLLGPTLWRRRCAPYSLRLQSYDTYEWLLVAIYLAKTNPCEIWLTNQRDRWVSLVDDHFAKRARSGASGDKMVIVQHGLTLADAPRIPKYKWITDFWYFDATSRSNFAKNTAANSDRIRWHEAQGELRTIKMESGAPLHGLSILFVSHRMHSARMRAIALLASARLTDATLYYKPHPLRPEPTFEGKGLQFIRDKDRFPRVDAVISYNSALAVEYAQLGIPVLYIEEKSDEELLESLLAFEAKKVQAVPGKV